MKLWLLFVLLYCVCTSAAALDHCERLKRDYNLEQEITRVAASTQKSYAKEVQAMLRLLGPQQVGWINYDELAKEIASVQLCQNVSETPLTGSGSRHGSVYFTKERIVVFNSLRVWELENSPEIGLLLMHEYLGALGYPDENYQITSLLYAQLQVADFGTETVSTIQGELVEILKTEARRTQNIQFSESGGISGVGGGGDPEIAFLKPAVAWMLVKNQDYFKQICGTNLSIARIVHYVLSMRLETDDAVEYPRKKTGFPNLFMATDKGNRFIQIKHGAWLRLKEAGAAGLQKRNDFVRDLALLSCAYARNAYE